MNPVQMRRGGFGFQAVRSPGADRDGVCKFVQLMRRLRTRRDVVGVDFGLVTLISGSEDKQQQRRGRRRYNVMKERREIASIVYLVDFVF